MAKVWICGACAKRSRDKYGREPIDRGWDESCYMWSVEVEEDEAERTQELNDQQRADNSPSTWLYRCEYCGCDTEGGSDYRECECCRDLPTFAECDDCDDDVMNGPLTQRQRHAWEWNHARVCTPSLVAMKWEGLL